MDTPSHHPPSSIPLPGSKTSEDSSMRTDRKAPRLRAASRLPTTTLPPATCSALAAPTPKQPWRPGGKGTTTSCHSALRSISPPKAAKKVSKEAPTPKRSTTRKTSTVNTAAPSIAITSTAEKLPPAPPLQFCSKQAPAVEVVDFETATAKLSATIAEFGRFMDEASRGGSFTERSARKALVRDRQLVEKEFEEQRRRRREDGASSIRARSLQSPWLPDRVT